MYNATIGKIELIDRIFYFIIKYCKFKNFEIF